MIIEIRTEKPRLPWSAGPARAVGAKSGCTGEAPVR